MTEPAAPRTVRRRSSTRATLIAAADAIFRETGSTSVSVEAVVARAGYTRGAFYSNFRTVDELFFAVYEQQAEAVFAVLEHELGAALDGHPTVDGVVQGVVHGLPPEDRWYAIRSVLTTRARHDPEVNALLRAHTDRFHATLQPLLVAALERAGRVPTVDPALYTRAVVAAHVGAVSQSVLFDGTDAVRVAAVEGCILGLTRPTDDVVGEADEADRPA